LSYAGAGSPRSSIYRPGMGYAGAGSPKTSVLKPGLGYAGAGSPATSLLRRGGLAYAGAGSPRSSLLHDAYINDNPPPGTFRVLPPKLSGLNDDVQDAVVYGPPAPTPEEQNPSIWEQVGASISSILGTTVRQGTASANNAITGAISGGSKPPTTP